MALWPARVGLFSMSLELRAIVQIALRGSFSAAAEDLDLTPSAVSKIVARMESRLGVRLIHRTTRRIALTPEGEIYASRAREILNAIAEAESEVSRTGSAPKGRLRINSVIGFGLHVLSPVLPEFMARYPDVTVELSVTDRVIDLLAEKADVAIRTGNIVDQSLVARKIGCFERRLYASPSYLEKRGVPRNPEQLANHDCIVLNTINASQWPFQYDQRIHRIEVTGRVIVDDSEAALCIAMAGGGIARFADVLVAEAVRDGRLVSVLTDFHAVEWTSVYAVYPFGRQRMPKVKALMEFLSDKFLLSARTPSER